MALSNRPRLARAVRRLHRGQHLLHRDHSLVQRLPAIAGQGTCSISEHVDAGYLNRPWSEVGEVELVDEADSTVHHQRLGRGADDDIDRISGVGLGKAYSRTEENKNRDRDQTRKLDHRAIWPR